MTRLELATSGVTSRHSNQTELHAHIAGYKGLEPLKKPERHSGAVATEPIPHCRAGDEIRTRNLLHGKQTIYH